MESDPAMSMGISMLNKSKPSANEYQGLKTDYMESSLKSKTQEKISNVESYFGKKKTS